MSDDTLIRVGDGVTNEWTLSPSNTKLTAVTVNGVAAAYTRPTWNTVRLAYAPAPGAQVAFTFTGTVARSGGADGTNRVYQFNGTSSDYVMHRQPLFEGDGDQDMALFELAGAAVGDAVTVILESSPNVPGTLVLVLPETYDVGTVRVVNTSGMGVWLVTKNSLGQPFQGFIARAPGVAYAMPGTTELVVMPHITETGFKVVQVNSLRSLVRPTYQLNERLTAPAAGDSVEFVFGPGFYGDRFMAYYFPLSFGIFSDVPCVVSGSFYAWDPDTRAFTMKFGDATWTPNAHGGVDFNNMEILQDLPKLQAGNGTHSLIPQGTLIRLTLVSFPGGTPPSRVDVSVGVSTMTDYS